VPIPEPIAISLENLIYGELLAECQTEIQSLRASIATLQQQLEQAQEAPLPMVEDVDPFQGVLVPLNAVIVVLITVFITTYICPRENEMFGVYRMLIYIGNVKNSIFDSCSIFFCVASKSYLGSCSSDILLWEARETSDILSFSQQSLDECTLKSGGVPLSFLNHLHYNTRRFRLDLNGKVGSVVCTST